MKNYEFAINSSFPACSFTESWAEYFITIEIPDKQLSSRTIRLQQTNGPGGAWLFIQGQCRGGSLPCTGTSDTADRGYAGIRFVLGPLPSGPGGYTFCAAEGLLCTVRGVQQVAYGADGHYVYRDTDGALQCDTATFRLDPVPGAAKNCFVKD